MKSIISKTYQTLVSECFEVIELARTLDRISEFQNLIDCSLRILVLATGRILHFMKFYRIL